MGYKLDKTLLINIIPHSALKNHAVKSNPLTNEPQKIATLLASIVPILNHKPT